MNCILVFGHLNYIPFGSLVSTYLKMSISKDIGKCFLVLKKITYYYYIRYRVDNTAKVKIDLGTNAVIITVH